MLFLAPNGTLICISDVMGHALQSKEQFFDLAHQQMKSGLYYFAKENLFKALDLGGDKVEISIDLASCMYITEDFESFFTWTQKAFLNYQLGKQKIDPSRKIAICLKLGKLLEEIGRISQALMLYEELFLPTNLNDQVRIQKINAQRLRLYCFIGDQEKMTKMYWNLERLAVTDHDSEIEIQHALMKYDVQSGSYKTAEERVLRAFEKWQMSVEHQQWIIFELLYSVLASSKTTEFNTPLIEKFEYAACGNYEKLLWDILYAVQGKAPLGALNLQRIEGLSTMCTLRILDLILRYHLLPDRNNEIIQKAFVYLSLTDAASKNMILKTFKSFKSIEAQIDQKLSVSFTQSEKAFLKRFEKTAVISIDEISQGLYAADLNLNLLNRLKVLISGINKKLGLQCGVARSFQIKNNLVTKTIEFPAWWLN